MIFVDSIQHYPNCELPCKDWCHMATDGDLNELHRVASRLGLGRAWFQDKPATPHYDLTPTKRAQALKFGAQAVNSRELARRCFLRPRLDTRSSTAPETSLSFPPEKGAFHMRESGTPAFLATLLQRDAVRSLTMSDPWGTLVALGAKRIETRSWLTPHRGPLAIYIAKTLPPEAQACCDEPLFRQALEAGGDSRQPGVAHNPWGLQLSQIAAVVWLDEVQRITPAFQVDEPERSFGLFTPGRSGWLFSQVYRLAAPLPVRGSLGVWEWHPPARFWVEIQAEYDLVLGGRREDG
jgi:hypothetical protein